MSTPELFLNNLPPYKGKNADTERAVEIFQNNSAENDIQTLDQNTQLQMCRIFLESLIDNGSNIDGLIDALIKSEFVRKLNNDPVTDRQELSQLIKTKDTLSEPNEDYIFDPRINSAIDGYSDPDTICLGDKILLAALFMHAENTIYNEMVLPRMTGSDLSFSSINQSIRALSYLLVTTRLQSTNIFSVNDGGVSFSNSTQKAILKTLQSIPEQAKSVDLSLSAAKKHRSTYRKVDNNEAKPLPKKPHNRCCSIFSCFSFGLFSTQKTLYTDIDTAEHDDQKFELI